MRVPLEWLREMVDLPAQVDARAVADLFQAVPALIAELG